jgi:hypothetical protein
MNEPEEQDPNEEKIEDLDVPEETADDIGGGRNPPGSDPVPIPYPN